MAKTLARKTPRLRSGLKRKMKKSSMKRTARKVTLRHGSGLVGRKKLVKKVVRKVTKKLIRAAGKKPAIAGLIGRVVHYYDRIGVAIVELKAPLIVGELVTFKRGEREFTQPVSSMQINHVDVEKAKKGDVVGVKVVQVADNGTLALRA